MDQPTSVGVQGASQSKVRRRYIGSELCPSLMPSVRDLEAALASHADPESSRWTLVTPTQTNASLKELRSLLDFLALAVPDAEIVANDWGVVRLLRRYPFPISLGRMFLKNKRDPRISSLFGQLPAVLQARYRRSNVLNASFVRLAREHGVTRLEIDAPPWGLDPEKLMSAGIEMHLRYPFTLVTTSRACPSAAVANAPPRFGKARHARQDASIEARACDCSRPCVSRKLQLNNPGLGAPLYLFGNGFFTRAGPLSELLVEPLARLLYQPEGPLADATVLSAEEAHALDQTALLAED